MIIYSPEWWSVFTYWLYRCACIGVRSDRLLGDGVTENTASQPVRSKVHDVWQIREQLTGFKLVEPAARLVVYRADLLNFSGAFLCRFQSFYDFHLCENTHGKITNSDMLCSLRFVFNAITRAGPRLNIKTVLSTYGDFHVKDKTAVRTSYL